VWGGGDSGDSHVSVRGGRKGRGDGVGRLQGGGCVCVGGRAPPQVRGVWCRPSRRSNYCDSTDLLTWLDECRLALLKNKYIMDVCLIQFSACNTVFSQPLSQIPQLM
jgi:hypothetical protein